MAKANGHYEEFQFPDGEAVPLISERIEVEPSRPAGRTPSPAFVETDGAVLRDGRILDLICTPGSPDKLAWLVWKNGEYLAADQVEFEGRIYVPPQQPRGLAPAMRFPAGLGENLTASELLAEIERTLVRFIDVAEESRFLISAFIVSTFFADRLPLAPYLAVCGPPGAGKSVLLRLLHCMTRRGLHAGDLTRGSLYKLVDLFSPTLLIDEAEFDGSKVSRDIMRLLRSGNRRGADTYVNGQQFRVFGPKVICSRLGVGDAALASRCIYVAMLPSSNILPVLDEEAEQEIAGDMQPKLERFRLEYYHAVHVPKQIDVDGFTPRMRDLTRVLAAPMLGDPELVARLMACLKPQDEDARLELHGQPEWVVANALFAFCHRSSDRVFIGNLTEEVHRFQAEIGESRRLTPETVGRIVRRSLNADTKRVGRGYYLLLSADRRRQIHQLTRNMGLTKADMLQTDSVRAGYGGPPCKLCAEFGLNTLPDGTELRCVNLPQPGRQRASLFEPEWKSN